MCEKIITIKNCRIEDSKNIKIEKIDWTFEKGQAWLIIGPNGGGKADFLNAISGKLKIIPNDSTKDSIFSNKYENSVEIVSLERAASLIEEERLNDESEYIEGGVDIGRTGRVFLAEAIFGSKIKKNAPLPEEAKNLETFPQVKLCGIEKILDRGLKYMSTGEIRRTLLCRALISGKKLLILSDPFAGLDIESRKILLEFFDTITKKQLNKNDSLGFPHIILGMERYNEIPDAISHVLEFFDGNISFSGLKSEYEKIYNERNLEKEKSRKSNREKFESTLNTIQSETLFLQTQKEKNCEILIEMNNVNVGWGDNQVLVDLNWKLKAGEHWLIRGPNGSGKTTFLELITGDNMQVFSNDIKIFGARRGSGETIWDIKRRLGIVSYRLHVEYRMVGSTTLENVIISGFRDSIGLYEAATDVEKSTAKKWLELGGFSGREKETFNSISYGEQRAILILRAAVKCPPLLILDEPCHGLDENYRQKILDLLEIVAQSGTTTMLHVTHDPTEVLDCEKNILEFHPKSTPMYQIICR